MKTAKQWHDSVPTSFGDNHGVRIEDIQNIQDDARSDLLKTMNIVADWLERSHQINQADMVARNLLLAKELRMAAPTTVGSGDLLGHWSTETKL